MTEKLSRWRKLMYGVGDVGFSLTSTIIGAYFAIFLTDVVGMMPDLAAAAILIGRSSDYLNDPLIGHISDRARTRWGRRRPFLLFGALPFGLAFSLLWWKPPLGNEVALAAYYAAVYVFYDILATLVYMPYFALTPELTADYDERTALTSYRMFFSILASLVAFTVPLMIVKSFSPSNVSRVWVMGLFFGLASALPLLLTFLGTRERYEHIVQEQPRLRESVRAALKNRPFIFGLGIMLLTWVAVDIVQAGLLYFVRYVAQREAQSDLIMATIFVVAIMALPIWERVSRRWNKQWAYVAGIAFWAVVQLALIMVTASTGLAVVLVLCVLAGIGVAAAHVLPWSIIPDAVEWDELQTGARHEGMFYSLITLAQKIASSFAIPLALLFLKWSNYVPNADRQPVSALWGIRIIIGPIPAALLCGGILFAILYPLNRTRYAEVVQQLEQRHKQHGNGLRKS